MEKKGMEQEDLSQIYIVLVLAGHSNIIPGDLLNLEDILDPDKNCYYNQQTPPGVVTYRTYFETNDFVTYIQQRIIPSLEQLVRTRTRDKKQNIEQMISQLIQTYRDTTHEITPELFSEDDHRTLQQAIIANRLGDSSGTASAISSFDPSVFYRQTTSGRIHNKIYKEVKATDPGFEEAKATFPWGKNIMLSTNNPPIIPDINESIEGFIDKKEEDEEEGYTLKDIITSFQPLCDHLIIFDMGCNDTLTRTGRSGSTSGLMKMLTKNPAGGNRTKRKKHFKRKNTKPKYFKRKNSKRKNTKRKK